MLRWLPFAMVRICGCFAFGIVLGVHFPYLWQESFWPPVLIALLVCYTAVGVFRFPPRWIAIASGTLGLIVLVIAGGLHLVNRMATRDGAHLLHAGGPIRWYSGVVTNDPEERSKRFRIELEVDQIWISQHAEPASGKVLLYFAKDSAASILRYGDQLLIQASLQRIPGPANPGEFDFAVYMQRKNIFHQQFVAYQQFAVLEKHARPGFIDFAFRHRRMAEEAIDDFVNGPRERGMIKALVLGVTDGIDNELLNAYAATGAMHILSVSGLHVGIIYGVIAFLLKPIGSHRRGIWIVAVLSLAALWSYALLTGLSPSVLRSVTMFSFVVVARPMGRDTNIFNTLAASGFLLLCYDPWLLMSMGFQLSYIAVLGIVYLQPKLYAMWEPESWLMDKVWQITSVSIAAQLATCALGFYYFHQFPVYFLISNLIVIPLSSLVLLGGVLLILVSGLPWLAHVVGSALYYMIQCLNGSVFLIEELPWSRVDGIRISTTQCWMMILMTIAVILFIERRRLVWFGALVLLTFSYTAVEMQFDFAARARTGWIVYKLPHASAAAWLEGDQATLFSDSLAIGDELYRRHVAPGFVERGISHVVVHPCSTLPHGLQAINVGDRIILVIHRKDYQLPDRATVDMVLVGHDGLRSLDSLLMSVRFSTLVLEATNSGRYRDSIQREARKRNLSCHAVAADGAFVLNLTP